MNRIFILHFAALELYPPLQNLIRVLEKESMNSQVIVLTTAPSSQFVYFKSGSANIKIIRVGKSGQRIKSLVRYFYYAWFYLVASFFLVRYKPGKVLYFETISSFPAYLYKWFCNLKTKLFIHYHEYTSPQEYASGMKLTRYFHKKEKKLYPKAEWISHTNSFRMNFFLQDIGVAKLKGARIVPNYPPKSWLKQPKVKNSTSLKIVYVGALSLITMYTQEFAEWVQLQHGEVTWSIYTSNSTNDTKAYLQGLQSEWIHLFEGVPYEQLSEVLKNYDVGVILYKGHIPNYVYNAPNKLFEYIICGLDVLFPINLIGSRELENRNSLPRVLGQDFTSLHTLPLSELLNHGHLPVRSISYSAEDALKELVNKLSINDTPNTKISTSI